MHVKLAHKLDYDHSYPRNFSEVARVDIRDAHSGEMLEERDFNGACITVANCAIAAIDVAGYSIMTVKDAFVNAATAANADGDNQIWAFLNRKSRKSRYHML